MAAGTIDAERVAVLRGDVVDRAGEPVADVTVSVLDHPELGRSRTRDNGDYEIVVNGGGPLTLRFDKDGFSEVQRRVDTPWQDWVIVDRVVLVPLDPQVTTIDQGSTADFQVARSTRTIDPDGARQATLLFAQGTDARMELPDGSTQGLGDLKVRATEYTVGNLGSAAMPGSLPPTSGYTYAVDFTVDEAEAADATTVRFDKPVINYTENFIGAPVGSPVPTGYYDKEQGTWVPAPNGHVIEVLAESGGSAEVDTDGDGASDPGAALGMTGAERQQLATLYDPGQQLWRVAITHFTPWDHNWPYGPPPGAQPPSLPWFNGEEPDPCYDSGSIIGCETQTLGESVPVAGTPFNLAYQSDRVPGWKVGETLDIPVTGSTLPARLKGVHLSIDVAGRRIERRWEDPTNPEQGSTSLPDIEPDLNFRFAWDGRDAFGRPVQGRPTATITVSYIYDPVYYESPDRFAASFGQLPEGADLFSGRDSCGSDAPAETDGFALAPDPGTPPDPATDPRFFCGVGLSQTVQRSLGAWTASGVGLGGWTLDVHHAYDPGEKVLYRGDGTRVEGRSLPMRAKIIAGGGGRAPDVVGGPALEANLDYLADAAIAPDGDIYAVSGPCWNGHGGVRRIDRQGNISQFAGNAQCGAPSGDGGPAREATLGETVAGLDVAPDGSVYLAVGHNFPNGYIRKITPGGVISTIAGIAGSVPGGGNGDGGLAVNAKVSDPIDVETGPDGSIYVSERGSDINGGKARVRRIDATGRIVTVAGGGSDTSPDEDVGVGEPATAHDLDLPYRLAVGPDGSVYIPNPVKHVVTRVGTDGVIRRFAGDRRAGNDGDGGPATDAAVGNPVAVAVGDDGAVYVRTDTGGDESLIRRIDGDGTITTVAGRTGCGFSHSPDDEPPLQACIFNHSRGLDVGPDGTLVYTDGRLFIRRVASPFPGFARGSVLMPSEDGNEVYELDGAGRHRSTVDALTGALRHRFGYDSKRRLATITDGDGNVTRIDRDGDGRPTQIVAPGGQVTTLQVNAGGLLSSIANPANEATNLTYEAGGLLDTFTDPRGSVWRFDYDSAGRLARDEGPGGRVTKLSRTQVGNSVTVTLESGLGRQTVYRSELLGSGDRRRTIKQPTGAATDFFARADGTRLKIDPDGTRTTTRLGPDPRWGMRAPVAVSEEVELPGGAKRTAATSYSAQLDEQEDPLSVRSFDRTVTYEDPGGSDASYTTRYDRAQRTITRSSGEGRANVTTLDAKARPVSIQPDEGGGEVEPITLTYDSRGRIEKVAQGAETVTYAYDSRNRAVSRTDAGGRRWQYGYDGADRVTRLTTPSARVYQFAYDAAGNRTRVVMPSGAQHELAHTAAGLDAGYDPPGPGRLAKTYSDDEELTGQALPGGRSLTTSYDAGGRPEETAYAEATAKFAYAGDTERFQTLRRTPAGGATAHELAFTYDGPLVKSLASSGPATGSYAYGYDARLAHKSMTFTSGADTVSTPITRDRDQRATGLGPFSIENFGPDGAQTQVSDGTAMTLALGHDAIGREASRALTLGEEGRYASTLGYDDSGRLIRKVETVAGTERAFDYRYDGDGRLTEVKRGGTVVETYGYDPNGNRTSRRTEGMPAAESATYDEQDRQLTQGSRSYSHNADGQLTGRGSDTFSHSARGELLEATVGGTTVRYGYDALRRRVSRTDANGTWQYFYGDPAAFSLLTAARSPSGQLWTFYYDAGGRLFAFERGSARYYVATDQVGTPRVVTDSTGAVVKAVSYDSFGVESSDSAPGFELPIGFAGGLNDELTGLVNFLFRDYDPVAGRWTTRDPARYQGGQFNLYAYVLSNPVQLRDPVGLGGVGGSFYRGIGGEAELRIGERGGWSVCVGVGVGKGASAGYTTGEPLSRSGIYTRGELSLKTGPIGITGGLEIDPCGKTTDLSKLKVGPGKIDQDGNMEMSTKPDDYTPESAESTQTKLEGKLSSRYCYSSLD